MAHELTLAVEEHGFVAAIDCHLAACSARIKELLTPEHDAHISTLDRKKGFEAAAASAAASRTLSRSSQQGPLAGRGRELMCAPPAVSPGAKR